MHVNTINTIDGQSLTIGFNGIISLQDATGKMTAIQNDWLGVSFIDNEKYSHSESLCLSVYPTEANEESLSFRVNEAVDGVICSGKFTKQAWGFTFDLNVRNASGKDIHSIWFRIGGISIDKTASFALPHGAGFIVPVSGLAADEKVKLHYPVFCSMQWMDLFCVDKGIYLGICDILARSKILIAGMHDGMPFMEVRFTNIFLKDGECFHVPPLHLMFHQGDWKKGAWRYGEWFHSVFCKNEAPEWCRAMPVWAWTLCKKQHSDKPDYLFKQLPDHRKQFAKLGIETLQISGYMENGHDAKFPDYEAGNSMGGNESLISCIGHIHEQGGKLSLYTNGRLVDPTSSVGEKINWTDWCVSGLSINQLKNMNAELRFDTHNNALHPTYWDDTGVCYKETYGRVDFAVMCPSSLEWQDYFIVKIENLILRYKPDGVYLDQICGAWGLVCYNDHHMHLSPSEAWYGYVKLTERIKSIIKNHVPEAYVSTEGVNDILGLHIDIFQAHNWGFRFGLPACARPAPDIFSRTLPDYLLFLGPVFKNDRKELRRAFVYGKGIDIAIGCISECEEEFVNELDYVIRSRQLLCPGLVSSVAEPLINESGVLCFSFNLCERGCVVLGAYIDEDTYDVVQSDIVKIPPISSLKGRTLKIITPDYEKLFYYEDGYIIVDKSDKMWLIMCETL